MTGVAAETIVKIWNPFTGELIRNLSGHTGGLSDIAWSSDSSYLASASDDTTIRIWEIDTVGSVKFSSPNKPNYRLHNQGSDIEAPQGPYEVGVLPQLQ